MAMKWYKQIKAVLNEEPELWLSYLYGQQLYNIKHLLETKPRHKGLLRQSLKLSGLLLRDIRLIAATNIEQRPTYFFFAGTINQMDSLDSTIEALKARGDTVVAIAPRRFINTELRKQRYKPFTLDAIEVSRSLLLSIKRGYGLHQDLRKLHPEAAERWSANFHFIYAYLVYFQNILSKMQPKFVITANDHSIPNRCMLAIAHQMGIKTVYLQHASVSNLFPALKVDYAFLDGKYAADIYNECKENRPIHGKNMPYPKVFLTGQKKNILKVNKVNEQYVGVALNALDNTEDAITLISFIRHKGYKVLVRWHPGQVERDIKLIREFCGKYDNIDYSEPKKDSISVFLSKLSVLIAGNSSVHLEAALADVPSIYHEISQTDIEDYYGFVKNGLITKATSMENIEKAIGCIRHQGIQKESVRYYSSTYETEWEGREGKLVANILTCINNGDKPPIDPISF